MTYRLLAVAGLLATALVLGSLLRSGGNAVQAVAGDHRAMVGLATTSAYILQDENNHGVPAYDLQVPGSTPAQRAANTVYKAVYAQTRYYSGGQWEGVLQPFISPSGCTGYVVQINDLWSLGNIVGRQEYVHIEPYAYTPPWWTLNTSGWTVQYLGYVKASDCYSSTPHLHQADEHYGWGKNNTNVDQYETWSTGSSSAWLFRYTAP